MSPGCGPSLLCIRTCNLEVGVYIHTHIVKEGDPIKGGTKHVQTDWQYICLLVKRCIIIYLFFCETINAAVSPS